MNIKNTSRFELQIVLKTQQYGLPIIFVHEAIVNVFHFAQQKSLFLNITP